MRTTVCRFTLALAGSDEGVERRPAAELAEPDAQPDVEGLGIEVYCRITPAWRDIRPSLYHPNLHLQGGDPVRITTLVLSLLLAGNVHAEKGWVDVELAIRLIEARERLVLELVRYGERHPRVKECRRRVRLLEDAIGAAPRQPKFDRERVLGFRAWLSRRAADAEVERLELSRRYLARHPRMVRAREKCALYRRLLKQAGRLLPPVSPSPSALLASKVAKEGTLAYLKTRYGPKHPRIQALRAEVVALSRALAAVKPEPCAAQREAFARAAASLRDGSPHPERTAAIDALVVRRAQLRCKEPAK
jgi:hypothetical protein